MTEESAWQTFSSIRKKEEDKLLNSRNYGYYYRSHYDHLNDIHVYDTDTTTDSEDYKFNKNYTRESRPINTNFVTPPKSTIDSSPSSPVDGNSDKEKKTFETFLNSINAHSNKINGDKEKKNFDAFLTTINDHSRIINKNLFNKDAVVLKTKHKMALGTHYKKDQKKRGMESAWTKFIKENP